MMTKQEEKALDRRLLQEFFDNTENAATEREKELWHGLYELQAERYSERMNNGYYED